MTNPSMQSRLMPRPGTPLPMRDKSTARLHDVLRHIDLYCVVIWILVTTFQIPGIGPVRYLLALYFTAGLFIHHRQLLPPLRRAWPFLIIPVLCLISTLWAPSMTGAVRKALLLGMTAVIGVYFSQRASARQIITAYFAVEMVAAILSIINPDFEGEPGSNMIAATGVFEQKNVLAIQMFFLFTAGMFLTYDKKTGPILRMLAIISLPMAAYLILLSVSKTTLVLMIATGITFTIHFLFWQPAAKIKHLRTMLALVFTILAAIAVLIVFALFQVDAGAAILEMLGKDSTLTGRTMLWDQARREIAENPWTGVGADGFWRPEVGAAGSILTFFHYKEFTLFSFHNSYLENGVQFGYPGYYATIFFAAWALYSTFRTWLRNQTLYNAFFLIIAVMIVIRSNTEPDLAVAMGGTLVFLLIAALRKEKYSED